MDRRAFLISATGAGLASTSLTGAATDLQTTRAEEMGEPVAGNLRIEQGTSLIGNLQAFMPGGIAFIKENVFGIVLDVGWAANGKPGSASPDFSSNTIRFEHNGAQVHFDWGKVGDEAAVARLSSDRPITLRLRIPARPWHGFNNILSTTNRGVEATAITPQSQSATWVLHIDPIPTGLQHAPVGEMVFDLELSAMPVRIAAGFNGVPEVSRVDALLDAAAAKYEAERARVNGPWGDFAAAIADNLNNSRQYSNLTKRVVHVIGRGGSWIMNDPDYPPYFAWDTSFNALLGSLEDPRHAMDTMRTLLSYQLENGMVAQIAAWNHDPLAYINVQNSNPPVTSLCAWKLYQRWPDRSFLFEVYERLLRWHQWWPDFSDGNRNGLLEWGSLGSFADARLACGWDDTPAFDGARQIGTQMNADAVDLNSLWSMDAEYLAMIADELGLKSDAAELRQAQAQMNRRINEVLWNEELGLYCHRLWSQDGSPGKFLTRLTPMNFYPLMCGAPDEKRMKRMMSILSNPGKFWGRWLVPTLAYDDPEWHKQEYWKGHVWAPVNYLIWQGLRRYGTPEQKRQFVERSVDLFMRNWTEHGTCNENYKSTDGSGDDYPHYTWGALMCQIGLEYCYEANAHGEPIPAKNAAWMNIDLRNMPSGGKLYRIRSQGGEWTVEPERH